MKKLSTIKIIVAGAVVGAGIITDYFLIFKLLGVEDYVFLGLVCVGMVYAFIINVLGYLRSKKEEPD